MCRYWANVWLVAATPVACVMACEFLPASFPFVFFGLLILGILVPYRFGRAPYSYVLVCGLIYFFAGSAIAIGAMYLLGIDGVSDPHKTSDFFPAERSWGANETRT